MALAAHDRFTPMSVADLDDVARVEQTLYVHPWTRGNFSDSITAGYSMRVLRCEHELKGYFVLMITPDLGHLLNLSVAQPWQRLGYGGWLIERAREVCLGRGVHELLLEVRPSNVAAQSLYKRCGFQQIGVRRGYYPRGDVDRLRSEDALVMKLSLAEPS